MTSKSGSLYKAGAGVLPVSALRRARYLAVALGIMVALIGAAVLVGWALHVPALVQVRRGFAAMTAGTAVAFLISGSVLAASVLGKAFPNVRALVRLGSIGVLALGALHGWMAALTTLYFVSVGAAFLLLDHDSDRLPHPSEWLACAGFWIGGLGLTGYMLSVPQLYRPDSNIAVAPHTSLAMILLALGLLCARPERGLAAIAVSSTSAGTLVRRLVPETLLVPPLGMWTLVDLAPRLGLFDGRLGMALATLFVSTVVAVLEAKAATHLAATDNERQAHQASLRRALADLAQALRDRDRVQKDLERSNRDLDEFAYAASHDLRAPLRGIANLAHWLEEDLGSGLPASARQQLDLLRSRVQRMEALIDGILKYSRAGRNPEPLTLVSVEELLRETIELVSPSPRARIEVTPGMPKLLTERAQLQQVFLNLISNAIKHAHREDPEVRISAEDFGDHVRFVVADNGPGIAPQYHERIWGMFQTLAARDQVEGTGIGLATVKKLIERRGGRVGVESAEGQGARFFFLWPRQQST